MKTLCIIIMLALSGCATQDYSAYANAQATAATAKANAETARYQALSQIAQSGTDSARVAAVMALALGNGTQTQSQQIAAPQPSQALQWAQVLAPSITSIASMHYSSRAAMASAESAARVSESTNAAFTNIAGKIQAPVVAPANVSTVTNTTTTSNANQQNTTSTANQANTSTANPTTVTLSGTGVVGSGTATNSANPSTTTTTTTTTNPTTQVDGKVCSVDATGQVNCK